MNQDNKTEEKKLYRVKMARKNFKVQKLVKFYRWTFYRTIFTSDNLDSVAKAIDMIKAEKDEILF